MLNKISQNLKENESIIETETYSFSSLIQNSDTNSFSSSTAIKSKINKSQIEEKKTLSSFDEEITSVPNPNFKYLQYAEKEIPIYANLYKLIITKNYTLYQYSLNFSNENDYIIPTFLKKKIMSKIKNEILNDYGNFILTGDSFYSMKEVNEVKEKISLYHKVNYSIIIRPTKEFIEMKTDMNYMLQQFNKGRTEIKTIFEIIIKEILRHNPSLKYVMKLFGNKDQEKILKASEDYNTITIMPGFFTNVMFLKSGIYLNVDIKTKILSQYNCLQLINSFLNNPNGKISREEIEEVNNWFKDKTIETINTNQRFKVERVNFEKRANSTTINVNNTSMNYVKYYKDLYNRNISPYSPLLNIRTKGKCSEGILFPPELCVVVGLNEEMINDRILIQNITKITKMNPNTKIDNINDIIKLINEKKEIIKRKRIVNEIKEEKLKSCFQLKNEYGIDIINTSKETPFKGRVINLPLFKSKDNKLINNIFKPFQLIESQKICFKCLYHKENTDSKNKLSKLMKNAAKSYDIKFGRSEFHIMTSEDPKEWMKEILKAEKSKNFNIIIILIDEYFQGKGLYDSLKSFCQEEQGVISQFICTRNLEKNAMSVVSNILIQINSKIGGVSYKVNFDSDILKRELMVIGVDSSSFFLNGEKFHSISFCASLDNDFSKYTNKKINVPDYEYLNTNYPISNFIIETLGEYFKRNNSLPKGIIIYRQGIGLGQREYIKDEVVNIENILRGKSDIPFLNGLNIQYYYILVNKKTSLKFFEIEHPNNNNKAFDNDFYNNPESGLLICDDIIKENEFEFYIQPQKVTQGTATPTNYTVLYGNMNCPKIIPKLTFDLCFIYSNWRGPVRIPAPLKYAEKLAKVKFGLNEKIKNNLSYI